VKRRRKKKGDHFWQWRKLCIKKKERTFSIKTELFSLFACNMRLGLPALRLLGKREVRVYRSSHRDFFYNIKGQQNFTILFFLLCKNTRLCLQSIVCYTLLSCTIRPFNIVFKAKLHFSPKCCSSLFITPCVVTNPIITYATTTSATRNNN